MADNLELNAGSGGATLATDELTEGNATVHYQKVKLAHGAADSATLVSTSSGLPVDLRANNAGNLAVTVQNASLTVDGSAVTQPVSAAALPLPSGASTAAKQPALGTAGTAATDVLTVQGIASMVALKVDGSGVTQPVSGNVGVTGNVAVNIQSAIPAGTNAIGKLAANSGVDIGDVDVLTLPARSRTTDTLSVALATDAVMSATTALTPRFAAVNVSTSGNNTLVAAVSGSKIRVTGCMLVAGGNVTVTFQDGAGGTALSGDIPLTQFSGFTLPFAPTGWMEGGNNTLLNLSMTGAVSVDGVLTYVEVPV